MVFNADKTKLKWFSLKKPDVKQHHILVFEDEDTSVTFEPVKDLGILFVSSLSPVPLKLKKRLLDAYCGFINLIKSLPKLISSQQKTLAPQTYFQPFLMYGFQIWFPNKSNIDKPEKLRSSVARWMSRETSYNSSLINLYLFLISLLFQLSDTILFH